MKNDISVPKKSNKSAYFLRNFAQGPQLRNLDIDFTLGNCLLGSVKLTKNAHLVKYKYMDYNIGLESRSEFLFIDGSYRKNVIVFGADMSSSVRVDNKGKDILIIGEELKQG